MECSPEAKTPSKKPLKIPDPLQGGPGGQITLVVAFMTSATSPSVNPKPDEEGSTE